MKRLLVLLFAALLLTAAVSAQIVRGKPSTPAKPKTEQKAKPKQSTPSSNSGKSKTTTKKTTKQQSSNRSSGMTQAQKDRIIQQAIDNMVYVEGGTFTMGATTEQGSDASSDEYPAHQVTLSSYYIGKYEVTQALWQAVMGKNPSRFTGDSRRPVEQVSWDECQEFIGKLNRLTGRKFRLPTEAEWEFAARGGNKSRGYKYAGSDNLNSVAWYSENSGGTTHPVGQKAPNELGLYDMSGNVFEWCQRCDSYSSGSQRNPTGPSSGSGRVFRGGSWASTADYCRVSFLDYRYTDARHSNWGLRLAL